MDCEGQETLVVQSCNDSYQIIQVLNMFDQV